MAWDQGKLQVLVLSGFLLCSLFSGFALGRDDPIEVLGFVTANWFHPDYPPLFRFQEEPLIKPTFIPASHWQGFASTGFNSDQVRKYFRKYFPRSYEELSENYEFILLFPRGGNLDFSLFTSKQLEWMRRERNPMRGD